MTSQSLGEIVKLKVKAYSQAWFDDKWFVRDMVIKKLGGKRCVTIFCLKKFGSVAK